MTGDTTLPVACTRKPGSTSTGCGCPDCKRLNTAARRARQARQDAGGTGRYSAVAIARHVRSVLAASPGAQPSDFAYAAGLSPKTVKAVLSAAPGKMVYTPTAKALLATRHVKPSPKRLVPGITSRRKVEALACAGWPIDQIAGAVHLSPRSLVPGNLNGTVYADTAARIDTLWRLLRYRPGPDGDAARRAHRLGYLPAGVWVNIDTDTHPDLSMLDGDQLTARAHMERLRRLASIRDREAQLREALRGLPVRGGQVVPWAWGTPTVPMDWVVPDPHRWLLCHRHGRCPMCGLLRRAEEPWLTLLTDDGSAWGPGMHALCLSRSPVAGESFGVWEGAGQGYVSPGDPRGGAWRTPGGGRPKEGLLVVPWAGLSVWVGESVAA